MRKLQVYKSTAYGALTPSGTITTIDQVSSLADGAIAIFTDDGVLITAANAATLRSQAGTPTAPSRTGYIIYQGVPATPGVTVKGTQVIPFGSDYALRAYLAPVRQVRLIGDDGTAGDLNLPTLVAGQKAHIRIQDMSLGTFPAVDIFRVESIVNSGSTVATIVADLVAKINAHPQLSQLVVAANIASTGISLTLLKDDTMIDVGLDGILSASTLDAAGNATTVAIVLGSGTAVEMSKIWVDYSSERGNTSQTHLPAQYFSHPNPVVAGATYDMYSISMRRDTPSSTGVHMGSDQMRIELGVPVGATFQANLNTILAAVN